MLGILDMAGMAPVGRSGPCRLAQKSKRVGVGAGTIWDRRLQIQTAQGKQRPEGHLPKTTS